MIVYPAIDIKDGKCVRLRQGKYDELTVYSDNPLEMALKWKQKGAEYIHVVDLDGARSGKGENFKVIIDVVKSVGIPVQLGGGIRSIDTIEKMLCAGLSRVILGTAAVRNPDMVKEAVKLFGEHIAVGIDAKEEKVAVEGWEKDSGVSSVELAKVMEQIGVETIIYTDIARDGMLVGPNLTAMKKMAEAVSIEVIASGGVAGINDIIDLKSTGVTGVIVGKALYTGGVDLSEALKAAK
jgi:phosphoribosylformimino-5-aminoimidazole carboxamide ribotide isomerase